MNRRALAVLLVLVLAAAWVLFRTPKPAGCKVGVLYYDAKDQKFYCAPTKTWQQVGSPLP